MFLFRFALDIYIHKQKNGQEKERKGGGSLFKIFISSFGNKNNNNKKKIPFFSVFISHMACVCVCLYGLIYKAYGVINHLFMRTGYTYIKEEENKMYTGKGKKKK